MPRTTTAVIQDHLAKRLAGDVEGDIAENYAQDVIMLSSFGVYHDHDGVQRSAEQLAKAVGEAEFRYKHTIIEGNYAFLEWTAHSSDKQVPDGVDSFVVENGKIVLQTVHYTAHTL